MPEHLAVTYPGHLFGVRYVPVPDLAPVPFGIAHLIPPTPLVSAFCAVARHTVAARGLVAGIG
jgi:hypothetical protein